MRQPWLSNASALSIAVARPQHNRDKTSAQV